jgi:hypothetical protein
VADPQVTSVLADAARLLGDPSQEQFTNTVLLPPYSMAYREVYDLAINWRLQLADRETYYNLPAQTAILKPSTAGIADMGEPTEIRERGNVTAATITGVSNATPMEVTTAAAHNLATNDEVTVSGVVGPVGVNDRWIITVTGAATFTLNGSVAGGAWVSGGVASKSDEDFLLMESRDVLPQVDRDERLRYWQWRGDTLYFVGATGIRQLLIRHSVSGVAPQAGAVGIDNSQNFLAARTASLIAPSYNMPQRAAELTLLALGPSGQPDGTGGYLRSLVNPMLKEKAKRPKRPMPFRPFRPRY